MPWCWPLFYERHREFFLSYWFIIVPVNSVHTYKSNHDINIYVNFILLINSFRYDMDFTAQHDPSSLLNSPIGPCPKLPVYKRYLPWKIISLLVSRFVICVIFFTSVPIFNRCVPEVAKEDGILDLNQNWNFVNFFFGNLYASWLQIIIIVAFSFRK